MTSNPPKMFMLRAAALIFLFSIPSVALAGNDDDSSPAPISPPAGILAGNNFNFSLGNERTGPKFKLERRQKARRGLVSEDKFTSSLKLPVPSQNLGINSRADASIGDVVLTFSRANSNYAACSVDFSSIKRYRYGLRAEYKVEYEAKLKKGLAVTRAKKGSCDIDMFTAGEQSGLPNLKSGDAYLVEVNGIAVFSGSL